MLVEATSISKTINERKLWSDMNLSVGPGEIFGVLGQSGSGKTTLLTCLGGLAPIDGGEIRIGDVRLDNASRGARRQLLRSHPGFLFRSHVLIDSWTIEQNLALAFPRHTSHSERRRRSQGHPRR